MAESAAYPPRPDLRQEDYDATAQALYTSALYGWTLERKGDVVRVVCTFCRYSFVRRLDDTMRDFVETAAQHEC